VVQREEVRDRDDPARRAVERVPDARDERQRQERELRDRPRLVGGPHEARHREPERRKRRGTDRQRHHGRRQHARVDVHAERRHGDREHEHDVNHIFAKAGVRDRAQAVVYAYGHGLAEPPG
jgi:hypothetical protein